MTVEHAIGHSLSKPWGVADPRPWSSAGRDDNTIGEIWYERSGSTPQQMRNAADAGPAGIHAKTSRLTDARILLTSNDHFTFEKIDLVPNSAWCPATSRETGLLVVSGNARTSSFDVAVGDAVFAQSDHLNIRTGTTGLSGLLAYTGGLIPELLQHAHMETIQ